MVMKTYIINHSFCNQLSTTWHCVSWKEFDEFVFKRYGLRFIQGDVFGGFTYEITDQDKFIEFIMRYT